MTEQNLLLQDFELSSFAQDILNSSLLQESRLNKTDNKNDEDDDDDDDVPLSKCLSLDSSQQLQRQRNNQSTPASRRPSQMTPTTKVPLSAVYSLVQAVDFTGELDEDLDDDEDLVPIGVLQDPTIKLLHPLQSAAEKYKNSILCRDPQLQKASSSKGNQNDNKHWKHLQQQQQQQQQQERDRGRRSSFDPASIHRISDMTPSLSSNRQPPVMRSVSTSQQRYYQSKHYVRSKKSRYHPSEQRDNDDDDGEDDDDDDDDVDDDDDIPLFQTCFSMPSTNVKVLIQQ